MSDKLSESAWTGFTKKQPIDLDDKALVKALARFDKVDEDKHEARQAALDEVLEQVRKQVVALAKRRKELGDKQFGLVKEKLDELLELAEAALKKTREAALAAASQESEEAESPALLTTKMVPLLRELRKPDVRMHALIGTAGKNSAVLVMRRPVSAGLRKLVAEALDATGGAKYLAAECFFDGNVLTFVVKAPGAGLAKRLREALQAQVHLRLRVKVIGDDGEEADGEDGGEDQAGVKPQAPPLPGEPKPEVAPPSPEQLRYEQRLAALEGPVAEALRAGHPESSKIRAVMGYAGDKAGKEKDYAAALKALDSIDKLLAPAPRPEAGGAKDAEPTAVRPPAKRPPPGTYAAMKAKTLPRLDMVRNRQVPKAEVLARRVTDGIQAADALSTGGDDLAAIASLRALVKDVEEILASERERLEERLKSLCDLATAVRYDLAPDMEPYMVEATVEGLLKGLDFATAKATLDRFEKALAKGRPKDLEGLHVLEGRRADSHRKANAQAARNTEQARIVVGRVIDDEGNLLLGEDVMLADPGLANPTPGSREEALKIRLETQKLLRDLPFIRIDDLASVAEELGASKEAGLPQSVHALQMLQRLQTDKAAQAALKSVKAPPDPSTAANEQDKQALTMAQKLIRNSLGLDPDVVLTDAHARRAAMAALLTEVRQGKVGSCFATASAIRVQRNKPDEFLADIAQLLSTGKLKRRIETSPGVTQDVEVPISRDMIGRKLDVKRSDSKLHLRPEMIAGLDALGVDQDAAEQKKVVAAAARRLRAERAVEKALAKVSRFLPAPHTAETLTKTILQDLDDHPDKSIEDAVSDALPDLSTKSTQRGNQRKRLATNCAKDFDDVNGSDDFTPDQLLEQIAKTRPGPLREGLLEKAQAAYAASDDNTLLRTWEYTVASMEDRIPGSTFKTDRMAGGIGEGVATACGDIAKKSVKNRRLTGTDKDNEKTVGRAVASAFSDRLAKDLKTCYDPEVQTRSGATSHDGSSDKGGWSLLFRGKKIDGQAAFEEMVKTVAEECKQDFGPGTGNAWPDEYVKRAKRLIDELKDQAETADFRDKVIDGLVAKSGKKKDDFVSPWTMAGGGHEKRVQTVYEGKAQASVDSSAYRYKDASGADRTVEDAEGLTHFVIDNLSKLVNRLPDGDLARNANVPVSTNSHAFSLMPGSDSLKTLLKQGKSAAAVIAELKEVEGAKNAKRRAVDVPIGDLASGFAADAIAAGVGPVFYAEDKPAVIEAVKAHFRGLGVESLPLDQFRSQLKSAIRQQLTATYPGEASIRDSEVEKAGNAAITARRMLDRVVPQEEYEPLIDAAMRKLAVPESVRDELRKACLAAIKTDAVVREDLAKLVRAEMRKLHLGDAPGDRQLTREAYDALKTDPERIAALKAAGVTVTAPAATYDKLEDTEAEALFEHGVCARLDARLDKALVEPRGLVFSDTNWGDGAHRTHFSMLVDPLSDPPALQMWQMHEDGSDASKVGDNWIKGNNWSVYADPETYGGATNGHEMTTAAGKTLLWESYRAELQGKIDDCVAANKGDTGQLRSILEIADARFAANDYAAADTALTRLAEKLAPVEALAGRLAKGLRPLQSVSDEIARHMEALRADAKQKKLKAPTPEQKEATAAFEVLGRLVLKLRSGVNTPEELATFVSDNRAALDYIDGQSPLGSLDLITALT